MSMFFFLLKIDVKKSLQYLRCLLQTSFLNDIDMIHELVKIRRFLSYMFVKKQNRYMFTRQLLATQITLLCVS